MTTPPPSEQVMDPTEETYCYGHPKTPTRLRCSRCDRPICGRCSIPASVGQHCPECVAEARRTAPKVRGALRAAAPAVFTIIVINVVVFVLQRMLPGLTPRFASSAVPIAAGEYWRLFTAMFLHSPVFLLHILFNMYVLYIYGPTVERAFGSVRFVAMYLAAGLGGSALSYALGECGRFSVGASGAIFGIAGVLLVFLYHRRHSTFVRDAYRNILLFIGLNLVFGFLFPGIDNLAHIGGVLSGVALGVGFDRAEGRTATGRQLATLILVVGATATLVALRTATFSC